MNASLRRSSLIGFLFILFSSFSVQADWQSIAPGIEYQEYTITGPNNLFVARMDRANTECTIDSMIARGALTGLTETVPNMASRYDETFGYWGQSWGQQYDVAVAINGDFFSSGSPSGGQIIGGWYAKRFTDFTGGSGFVWQLDREAFIGECVRHVNSKQKVSYPATGDNQNFHGINVARGTDELIVYTHHKGLTTGTDDSGSEVLVKMSRPTLILPTPSGAVGTVVEIRQGMGATIIPFDHVVLSAHGSAETKLLQNVSIGSEVKISQEITHYEHDCSTSIPLDWTKTYSAIGGSFHFLKDGVVQYSSDPGATARHPRTAIAYNDDYIFFVVVDGRSSESIGMNMTELGNFCLTYLSATDGLNQDGGGSSTMWVDGTVMNEPSDGSPRAVANGLMMIHLEPMELSGRFLADDSVRVYVTSSMRVGPGINYSAFTSVVGGSVGVVVDHALNGILAKGDHWWWCEFDGTKGWLPGSALQDSVCAGDFDLSGAIDAGDVEEFVDCIWGPTVSLHPLNPCLLADTDNDRDVDLDDFTTFQWCYEGP